MKAPVNPPRTTSRLKRAMGDERSEEMNKGMIRLPMIN